MTEREWNLSCAWKWGVIESGPAIFNVDNVAAIETATKQRWKLNVDYAVTILNLVAWRGLSIAASPDPARANHKQEFQRLLEKFESDCARLPWPFPELAQKASLTVRHDERFEIDALKIKIGGNDNWRQLELLRCILGAYEAITQSKVAETKNGPTMRFLDVICDRMIVFCDNKANLQEQRDIWVKVRGSDKESWKIGFIGTTEISGTETKEQLEEIRKDEISRARLAITNQRDSLAAKAYRLNHTPRPALA